MSIFSRITKKAGATGLLTVLGLVLAAGSLTGCAYSQDEDVFSSTALRPTSLAIIDTLQKKVVWSMDIPVGQKLLIDYNGQHLTEAFKMPATHSTQAEWALYHIGDDPAAPWAMPIKQGTIKLNGDPIRAKVSYRPAK